MATYEIVLSDMRGHLPTHTFKKYAQRDIPWRKVCIHHSLTRMGNAEIFARYHVETNGWPGIGYHYVIGQDGEIEWCWDTDIKTYHAGRHNAYAVGICLTGNFLVQEFKSPQRVAAFWLLCDILDVADSQIIGHSELSGYEWKDCPCIDMDDMRREYANFRTDRKG